MPSARRAQVLLEPSNNRFSGQTATYRGFVYLKRISLMSQPSRKSIPKSQPCKDPLKVWPSKRSIVSPKGSFSRSVHGTKRSRYSASRWRNITVCLAIYRDPESAFLYRGQSDTYTPSYSSIPGCQTLRNPACFVRWFQYDSTAYRVAPGYKGT